MPADVIKRVNRMVRKSRPGLLFADRHNICVDVPINTPESDPDSDSDLLVTTTVMVDVSSDDNSTNDDYDPDDGASSESSIDDSIVFEADFPNHNVDDKITGVDQN